MVLDRDSVEHGVSGDATVEDELEGNATKLTCSQTKYTKHHV
jgi:hypothetical protein